MTLPGKQVLSVSDSRGRMLAQQSSAAPISAQPGSPTAPFSILSAGVPVWHQPTFYAKAGNWFAWLDLILAVGLLASATLRQG